MVMIFGEIGNGPYTVDFWETTAATCWAAVIAAGLTFCAMSWLPPRRSTQSIRLIAVTLIVIVITPTFWYCYRYQSRFLGELEYLQTCAIATVALLILIMMRLIYKLIANSSVGKKPKSQIGPDSERKS